jgi:diguanylate cyclase (GGDEF)-like protein
VAHERSHVAQRVAHQAAARAEYLANTDALTGLANRRPVTTELDALARPGSAPYCLAIADLDAFKELNDTFGHACGDTVLAAVGRTLRASVRAGDLVGRWGGEEFIFVLVGTSLTDAVSRSERVRAAIEDLVVDCSGHVHTITVSVGVADGVPGMPAFRVLKRADDAMYDAKNAGRNTVRSRGRDVEEHLRLTDTRSLRIRGASS